MSEPVRSRERLTRSESTGCDSKCLRAFGSTRRHKLLHECPSLRFFCVCIRRTIESTPSRRLLSAFILPIRRASPSRVKKHLSSSSLPSLVTRIVTPAPRRSFPSLPLLTPHRHPRGAARVSPSKRTRHLIVQVLVLPLLPEVVSRTIRRSSSGSALPGVNPRRKERHEGRRIRA